MAWMRRSFCAAVTVLAVSLSGPAFAGDADTDASIDNLLGDHETYKAAIEALNDAGAVSALVSYPITVTVGGKKVTIASASAFADRYADIITPEIATVIESQNYGELFVNSDGIMFGNGEVWINGICKDDGCSAFDARVITIQPAS